MYAIAHIIYGTYVPSDVYVYIPADVLEQHGIDLPPDGGGKVGLADWISEGDEEPFETHYRGSGAGNAIYAGVELDCFDEACDAVDIATLRFSPTSEQYDEAQAKLSLIPMWMRKHLPPIGTYLVWSSS